MNESYFGGGTTPERVREALERATERKRDTNPPSTAQREAFFAKIAEERKRAEAGS
jgi:hypothetical protein